MPFRYKDKTLIFNLIDFSSEVYITETIYKENKKTRVFMSKVTLISCTSSKKLICVRQENCIRKPETPAGI
ncbi:MAG: hypothetical protein PWP71_1718 [Clostridia bacterium]|jgi:hypothetical protein|nr:hypothetical protein [Clostridia bacterium]